ncbi:MAG: hypothetical protein ACC619_03230 [Paracoccaceae bacterium]
MGRGKRLTQQAAFSVLVLGLGGSMALAQTLDSPITATIGLSSGVTVYSNKFLDAVSPGTTIDASEKLSFSLGTQNSIQSLSLSGSASLSITDIGGAAITYVSEPRVTLSYARDTGNSTLDASANFWNGTVVSSFDLDPTDAVFLVVDTGTLTTVGASLAFSTGINAPLGLSLSASVKDNSYAGTSNPALFDATTTKLGASANLRLSPSTQGALSANYTNYDSSDLTSTRRQTTDFGLSISQELASALVINGNAGFRQEDTTAGGPTTTTSGFFGGIDVVRSLPDGSIFGGIAFDASGGANNTSLTLGRAVDLRNGSLRASLEANKSVGSPVQLLGSAAYSVDMPSGTISLDLKQSLTTDQTDQDIKVSSLGIDYSRALNASSSLNLSMDVSRTEDGGAGAADTLNRANLSATYSRALTDKWNMQLGYSRRLSSGSAAPSVNSDTIFLTLTRDIQFGF